MTILALLSISHFAHASSLLIRQDDAKFWYTTHSSLGVTRAVPHTLPNEYHPSTNHKRVCEVNNALLTFVTLGLQHISAFHYCESAFVSKDLEKFSRPLTTISTAKSSLKIICSCAHNSIPRCKNTSSIHRLHMLALAGKF